jgi:hypothetical protein
MSEACPHCHTVIPANLPPGRHGRCPCGVYGYSIDLLKVVPAGTYEWLYRARLQGMPAGGMDAPLFVTETHWECLSDSTPDDSNDTTLTDQEAAVLKVLGKPYPCRRTVAQIADEMLLGEESVKKYLLKLHRRKPPLVNTPDKKERGRTLTDAGRDMATRLSDAAGAEYLRRKTP